MNPLVPLTETTTVFLNDKDLTTSTSRAQFNATNNASLDDIQFEYEIDTTPDPIENEAGDELFEESAPVDTYWETHGHVYSLGDGIIIVFGLYNVTAGEMVKFPRSHIIGMALNLSAEYVGVLPFGDEQHITEGDVVVRMTKLMSVPVGEALLGRVVDPLGIPIDVKELFQICN